MALVALESHLSMLCLFVKPKISLSMTISNGEEGEGGGGGDMFAVVKTNAKESEARLGKKGGL